MYSNVIIPIKKFIKLQCVVSIISTLNCDGIWATEGTASLSKQSGHGGIVHIENVGSDELFCNLIPEDVVVSRSSQNQGFHRTLITELNFTFGEDAECDHCWVLLVEAIPNGMYVDLYQVESAEPFGGAKVLAFEDIDVEKPAHLSPEHTILVYAPHHLTVTESRHNTVQVTLPIHLRYHRPSVDSDITSALVKLGHPHIMIRCQGSTSGPDLETFDLYQIPCNSSNTNLCAWQNLQYHNDNDEPLHFVVPVGQQSHTKLVSFLTICATITGMAVILWVIFTPQKNKIT